MSTPVDIAAIMRDGNWFAHRYDPGHDAFHFVRMPRAVHRDATFLTDEYLPAGLETVVIARADAMAVAPPPAPVHFIFHSAFCCSTMLVRAMDIPGVAMGLKEPPVFNDIVGWRHRGGGPPARVAQVLDQAVGLLARPLGARESTVIKPSNLANGLARGILAMRPDTRAVLVHAPVETYVRSIAKKGMTGRLWVRDLLAKLLREGLVDLGFTSEDYLSHTDLQVAAVGWLAQQALFARLASEFEGRVRTLDSETLLAQPEAVIGALSAFYGLDLSDGQSADIAAGPAFTRHSKSGAAFGITDRQNEYDAAAALHGDEIDKVLVWADAVATNAGVAMALRSALIA